MRGQFGWFHGKVLALQITVKMPRARARPVAPGAVSGQITPSPVTDNEP